MTRPRPPLRCAALAALAAVVLGAGEARAAGAGAELVRRLVEVPADAEPERLEELALELAALPGAPPAVLAIRATGRIAAREGDAGVRPTAVQTRLLERVVPHLDSRALVDAVEEGAAGAPDAAWRLAALELLRDHASAFDVRLLAALVHDADGEVASESAHLDAFRAAMAALLERDPRTFSELDWLRFEPVPVRLSLLRAVGRSARPEALAWLGQELAVPELEAVALQELGRKRRGTSLDLPLDVAERVRGFLFAPDASLRRQAIRAVGALGDELAVPQLILLLDEGAGSDRRAAHETLRALTGRELPARAADWTAWHRAELDWLHERGQAALDGLRSEADADVVAAIRAISARGLWRDRIALELVRLLHEHPSPGVRAQACLGLARLRSDLALPDLVDALGDPDPDVCVQACSALRALTGREVPPEPEAWEAVLEARGARER